MKGLSFQDDNGEIFVGLVSYVSCAKPGYLPLRVGDSDH